MSSSISRVIFNNKCPACKKLYTRHHRSCGTQSHRRNRNNKVADGLQSDDLSTPSGSSPRFDGTHEADYQPHGGSDSVLVGERGDNIRPPAGKLIEIRSSSSPGTHGGTAACQTVARAASIPYDKGGPLSRVPSDGLGLGLLDWRFIVTILPADQPSYVSPLRHASDYLPRNRTCVWNRHRLSQHLLEASHDASLLLSDKQKAAELANKLVDRNDYQLQAKVTYRCSVLLRLKGDIKGSEGIIRSFFSMASSVIDTVAEEDLARLYLSQANNYAYHLMFENAHEEMRRVRSWVRHEESSLLWEHILCVGRVMRGDGDFVGSRAVGEEARCCPRGHGWCDERGAAGGFPVAAGD
ncbi:hypothetical protein B0H65DRAFT_460897 [Neurospora tetraspora]|uniref:Uncharacterized protein n=1 Tax=Neurospora tetraspora TaxID=94610 RepID=A0AAE0JH75_9PEZI|nr:hypothetical protein B0H65DRAFT_460897 [Neurospora tetraspora]